MTNENVLPKLKSMALNFSRGRFGGCTVSQVAVWILCWLEPKKSVTSMTRSNWESISHDNLRLT